MLTIPTKKLIIHDDISDQVSIRILLEFISNKAIISEPIMIGMLSKKENVVTSFLSAFSISPVAIVLPLRLMPGKHAIPCAIPINNACFTLNPMSVIVRDC